MEVLEEIIVKKVEETETSEIITLEVIVEKGDEPIELAVERTDNGALFFDDAGFEEIVEEVSEIVEEEGVDRDQSEIEEDIKVEVELYLDSLDSELNKAQAKLND